MNIVVRHTSLVCAASVIGLSALSLHAQVPRFFGE